MFRRFSAVFRELFDKEKYTNGYLQHRCAITQLHYKILKWLKTFKKYNTEYTLYKYFQPFEYSDFQCIMAHL